MSDGDRVFIYRNARGRISAQKVLDVSESDVYIQGISLDADEIRTFRKDRVLEYISDSTLIEERLEYHIETDPRHGIGDHEGGRGNYLGSPEVCFTGFKKVDRDRLGELAESAGMFVRLSVTVNLEFLCCGYNAGPKKIEKARHQGVVVLSESQFISLLETGEVPEEA